jgi:CRP-like cAMP-binding protein
MAIVHQRRVHVLLHMLLWHLAGRWGRVRTDPISIALPLSHTMLADLVADRRPTVTAALGELEKPGLVRRAETGLLLLGEPPGELLELRSVALPGRVLKQR